VAGQSSWLVQALQYSALPDPSLGARLASTSVLRAFLLESRADVLPSGKGQLVLSQATARSVTCWLTAWNKVLERILSTQRILTVTKLHPTPTSFTSCSLKLCYLQSTPGSFSQFCQPKLFMYFLSAVCAQSISTISSFYH